MTQEEKQLLLQDLCARLPYGVQYKDAHGYKKTIDIWSPEFHTALNTILYDGKPSLYLRPLSSMTEEEDKEYTEVIVKSQDCSLENSESATTMANDWLLSKGFDVRGLISKGLALEAPEDMYK